MWDVEARSLADRKELVRGRKLYKGTLADYPRLREALQRAGHWLPPDTKASVLKTLCKSLTAYKAEKKYPPSISVKASAEEVALIKQRAKLRKMAVAAYVRHVAVRAARFDWGF